jgi:hypothetical protein
LKVVHKLGKVKHKNDLFDKLKEIYPQLKEATNLRFLKAPVEWFSYVLTYDLNAPNRLPCIFMSDTISVLKKHDLVIVEDRHGYLEITYV